MILHTASESITFTKKLENDSATFYEELAQRFGKDAEMFLFLQEKTRRTQLKSKEPTMKLLLMPLRVVLPST